MTVFGTRPDTIKMAPVVHALAARRPAIEPLVCVTAQHRKMLDDLLALFAIVPDYDLDMMRPDQTLTGITTRVLEGMEACSNGPSPTWCSCTATPRPARRPRWRRFTGAFRWARGSGLAHLDAVGALSRGDEPALDRAHRGLSLRADAARATTSWRERRARRRLRHGQHRHRRVSRRRRPHVRRRSAGWAGLDPRQAAGFS